MKCRVFHEEQHMSGESKKEGIPGWVTWGIGFGLAVFYAVWLTHSFHWNYTPFDATVATVLTGWVPVGTIYILAQIVSFIVGKPFEQWSTED
jgi:glycerol uptake facilitator-like aquaporin